MEEDVVERGVPAGLGRRCWWPCSYVASRVDIFDAKTRDIECRVAQPEAKLVPRSDILCVEIPIVDHKRLCEIVLERVRICRVTYRDVDDRRVVF